ncbi:hypothetical protein [Viscerimonas tarda]
MKMNFKKKYISLSCALLVCLSAYSWDIYGDDDDMWYGGMLPEVTVYPEDDFWDDDFWNDDDDDWWYDDDWWDDDDDYTDYDTTDGARGQSGVNNNGNTNNNNSSSKKPATRTDCPPKAAANSNDVTNTMSNYETDLMSASDVVDDLRDYAANRDIEYGMAINNIDGDIHALSQPSGEYAEPGTANYVSIRLSTYTYMVGHTHPISAAPSTPDAAILVANYKKGYYNIRASVIFLKDGSEYAIYVDDITKFDTFCNSAASNDFSYLESPGSDVGILRPGSTMESDYKKLFKFYLRFILLSIIIIKAR